MRSRLVRMLAALVATFCSLAVLAACGGSSPKPDQKAAEAYLSALGAGDVATAAAATTDPAAAKAAITASRNGLGDGAKATFHVTSMTGRSDTAATAHYSATWTLPGVTARWTYDGTLPLTRPGNGDRAWQVDWRPSDVAPQLSAGEHLELARVQPSRASLDDSSGQPLFTQQPVVDVSLDPAKAGDLTAVAAALASALNISAADIVSAAKATPAGQASAVITLRQAAYEAVKPKIYNLPGVYFTARTELLGPSTGFAQPLLGRVGPATKELIDSSGGTIAAGDVVGLSGLQAALNTQLSGTPGYRVQAVNDSDGSPAKAIATLSSPKPGTPVTLTLDRTVQQAADNALAAVSLPASIVVTQPSTGKVLAVANSAAADGDIALTGQYPPGSTFKISTYLAALTAKPSLTPASTVACPATIVVNGQTVRNENDFALGAVPLTSAFAFSCNTSAATLGLGVPSGGLVAAAKSLGLGADWKLPVDAFSGSLPEPATPNETAADSYGQGKVLVSPLSMAVMVGSAATGRTVAPSLVAGPAAGQQATPGAARPATITGYLNTLMRSVVTTPGATGYALHELPGQVEGKTGTAEFGTQVPAQTHSWFVGVRGDLAFSVFVYNGGSSTTGAVPIAKTLLTALPPS